MYRFVQISHYQGPCCLYHLIEEQMQASIYVQYNVSQKKTRTCMCMYVHLEDTLTLAVMELKPHTESVSSLLSKVPHVGSSKLLLRIETTQKTHNIIIRKKQAEQK